MRRLLLLALAFLAACGGSSQEAEISNQAIKRVLLHAYVGSVQITTHASGSALLEADTSEPNDLDEFMIFKVEGGVLTVRPVDAALEWETDIELTLPELIELEVAARKANVQVEGSYKVLNVNTTIGDLDVHVERVGGGSVTSMKGRVAFTTQQASLAAELAVSSAMGHVNATLPARYRGGIYLNTKTGTLKVPDHKDLHFSGGTDHTALGYAGDPLSDKEREQNMTLGAFRATSASGTVTFSLAED
ncbi:MAG: DUF4097 family beta strand repeat-containing protein [Planctomycetota bacterium]|jgi:hypothetical protein